MAPAQAARAIGRRLVVPVLGAAAGVAALALVVTAEIVPARTSDWRRCSREARQRRATAR